MPPHASLFSRRAFTLIELLVVIAIIAILSIVVILVLNPSQLLQQSRDSSRVSDMASINSVLNIYAAQGGTSLGSSSVVYISIPDPVATSSAGDQCQGLSLPSAPSGTTYFCGASSTYRNVNGTGWIPVNLTTLAGGSPLGELPIDPLNTSSTGNYYTYATNGTQFVVTAIPESTKYRSQYNLAPSIPSYPGVIAQGTNLTVSPLYSTTGLVGYWPFEEGAGSSTADTSGNGNNGTWVGTSGGTNSTHYTSGKVGIYAGSFDMGTAYVQLNTNFNITLSTPFTLAGWAYATLFAGGDYIMNSGHCSSPWEGVWFDINGGAGVAGTGQPFFSLEGTNGGWLAVYGNSALTTNTWYYIVATYNGNDSQSGATIYVNGVMPSQTQRTVNSGPNNVGTGNFTLGGCTNPSTPGTYGYLDDVRIYNRALSASEVSALYNAEK